MVFFNTWWFGFVCGLVAFPAMVVVGTFFFFVHLELVERRLAKLTKVKQMREILTYKKEEVGAAQ